MAADTVRTLWLAGSQTSRVWVEGSRVRQGRVAPNRALVPAAASRYPALLLPAGVVSRPEAVGGASCLRRGPSVRNRALPLVFTARA